MGLGERAEEPECERPDTDEEDNDKDKDGPSGCMLARPKVLPVTADGGREEEILEDDGDEEPLEVT